MAGSALGKVGFAIIVVGFIAILVALIADALYVSPNGDADNYEIWGSTEYRFDYSYTSGSGVFQVTVSGDGESSYADGCEDAEDAGSDDSDICDVQGRGVAFIILNVISLIAGLICILGGLYYECSVLALIVLFKKKVVGISCAAIAGSSSMLAAIIWIADNPIEDGSDWEGDDYVAGISFYLTLLGGIAYLVSIFFFLKIFDGIVPE